MQFACCTTENCNGIGPVSAGNSVIHPTNLSNLRQQQLMTPLKHSKLLRQPTPSFCDYKRLASRISASCFALFAAFSIRGAQTIALETVHAFSASPRNPIGSLIQTPDGLLYGVSLGGTNRYGAVFRMTTNGALVDTVSLDIDTGESPCATLAKGKDGD